MQLDVPTITRSWPWRIKRAGCKIGEFCKIVNVPAPTMSQYTNGTVQPSAVRFLAIENALAALEKEKGVI